MADLPGKRRGVIEPRYAEWIAAHYPTRNEAVGACASATLRMVAAFPELRRVRGYVNLAEHWWCETQDGAVVDPTAVQYGDGEYRALDESQKHPTGYCENRCGAHVWDHATYCSEECERERIADMEADLRDSGMVQISPGVWGWPSARSTP